MHAPTTTHPALNVIFTRDTVTADAVYQVRQVLEDWGLDRLVEAVCLVTIELLDNAAEHAGGPISLCMELHDSVFLEVYDASPDIPQVIWPDETHRGLLVVNQLTDNWGTIPNTEGKCIYAEFCTTP